MQARGKAKKRERPLGVAIGLGLAATLLVGVVIAVALLLTPGTVAHQFFRLVHNNASATLPLDPLYQEWAAKIQEEDTLFGTPISLLCGGLVLGWLAPHYASNRRVLVAGALMGLGVLAASLGFVWTTGIIQQSTLNAHEGGQQVVLTAPPELILHQTMGVAAWTAVCVLGTWLGLLLRDRGRNKPGAEASDLRTAER